MQHLTVSSEFGTLNQADVKVHESLILFVKAYSHFVLKVHYPSFTYHLRINFEYSMVEEFLII